MIMRTLHCKPHCTVQSLIPRMLLSSLDCTMYPSVLGRRWYLDPSVIAGIIIVMFTDKYFVKVFVFCPS